MTTADTAIDINVAVNLLESVRLKLKLAKVMSTEHKDFSEDPNNWCKIKWATCFRLVLMI